MCPCRYIFYLWYRYYSLNSNLSDIYAFTKEASTKYNGLGYNGYKEKLRIRETLREKVLENFSVIICMSERKCWTLSNTVQKGQYLSIWKCTTTSIYLLPLRGRLKPRTVHTRNKKKKKKKKKNKNI